MLVVAGALLRILFLLFPRLCESEIHGNIGDALCSAEAFANSVLLSILQFGCSALLSPPGWEGAIAAYVTEVMTLKRSSTVVGVSRPSFY